MKNLIIITLVFFSLSAKSQINFFRYYPDPLNEYIYSVAETADHHFLLCGSTMTNSFFNNGSILKINDSGDIVQKKNLNSATIQSFFSSVKRTSLDSTGYILVGKEDSISNGQSYNSVKIWKLDDSLNFTDEFTYRFGNTVINTPQAYVNINDSLLFIVSSKSEIPQNNHDFSLLKYNLYDGSWLYYQPENNALRNPTGLLWNNTFSRLSFPVFGNSLKESGPSCIFTFDQDLNFVSQFEPDYTFISNIGMSAVGDSAYVISGTLPEGLYTDSYVTIKYRFDNIQLDSVHLYTDMDTLVYPGFGVVNLVLDSCIWVVGMYNTRPEQGYWQNDPSWIQLNKINSRFELCEQLFYGGDAYYFPYNVISTDDGGLMVVGTRYDALAVPHLYQHDPFVLKVNSEGLIVEVNNPEKPITQEAIVMPNPGRDYLQVRLAIQHKTAAFQLFDINGRLMLEESIQGDMQRIETGKLVPGIYIYRITAANRVIGSGKWVKE